jgi:hypothetical protein
MCWHNSYRANYSGSPRRKIHKLTIENTILIVIQSSSLGICQHAGLTAQMPVIKPAQNRQNKGHMMGKKQYTRSTRAKTLNLKKCK